MRALFSEVVIFFVTWMSYFLGVLVLALAAVFLMAPIVLYLRFSVVDFFPEIDTLLKIGKAALLSSFLLTILSTAWKFFARRERDY